MPYMTHNNTLTPLTPAVLHILLALSMEERHGYGIMKQVEMDSRGKVNIGPGTLYGSLKRMLEAGLVKESDKRVDPEVPRELKQLPSNGCIESELLRSKLTETVAPVRSDTALT